MNTAAFQLTLGGFTHRCVVPAGDAKNTCIYPPPPLVDLQVAINRFLAEHNRSPKPFVWTADPNRGREPWVPNIGFDPRVSRREPRNHWPISINSNRKGR